VTARKCVRDRHEVKQPFTATTRSTQNAFCARGCTCACDCCCGCDCARVTVVWDHAAPQHPVLLTFLHACLLGCLLRQVPQDFARPSGRTPLPSGRWKPGVKDSVSVQPALLNEQPKTTFMCVSCVCACAGVHFLVRVLCVHAHLCMRVQLSKQPKTTLRCVCMCEYSRV